MNEKDRIFTVNKDGTSIELYIANPSLEEREKAESVRLRAWNRAVKDGAIFQEKLNDVLREQGLWSTEKEDKQNELREELIESIRRLKKGGIKLSEAKNLAIGIRRLRNEINVLSMDRVNYINDCVEGQSQNAEFNYLVSQCVTVYNTKKKYFDSYEDYLNRSKDIDGYLCAAKFAEVFYGGNNDTAKWPENEFLTKYKFVDSNLRLINEDGKLIDPNGRLINEFGDYITIIDGKEIIINENGEQIEKINEVLPFLDEENNPIVEIVENTEVVTEPIEKDELRTES